MANTNVVRLCNLEVSTKDRLTDNGKLLKSIFMLGPSKAVISNGKIIDSGTQQNNQNQPSENSQTDNANNQNQQPENSQVDSENSQNQPSENSQNDSAAGHAQTQSQAQTQANDSLFREHSYTILEACLNLNKVFEAEDDTAASNLITGLRNLANNDSNTQQDDTTQSSNQDSDNAANDSDDEHSQSDSDSNDDSDNDEAQDTEDNNNDESTSDNTFNAGEHYTFRVVLPNEGYTEWEVVFNSACSNIDQAKNYIRAKKFKQAYNIASDGVDSDGFVPVRLSTFVVDNMKIAPPFIGHCRYGFDSGSEDGEEDNRTICLAIAPINARTNKTDSNLLIQTVYNVVGDISDGKLANLLTNIRNAATSTSDDRYYNDNDDSDNANDELSKFLHKKFKCVGDQTMYKYFLEIKKFIQTHLKNNNLEYVKDESTNIMLYENTVARSKVIYF